TFDGIHGFTEGSQLRSEWNIRYLLDANRQQDVEVKNFLGSTVKSDELDMLDAARNGEAKEPIQQFKEIMEEEVEETEEEEKNVKAEG
ncbi:hypothetical protein BC938DRAFT_473278, partial [Jimgerdemannia flammicorona]